jgi:hypothetical protein
MRELLDLVVDRMEEIQFLDKRMRYNTFLMNTLDNEES